MYQNNTIDRAAQIIDSKNRRSAWDRGVNAYAHDLLESLDEAITGGWFEAEDLEAPKLVERELLNGAADWRQYSESGNALIYDGQIAERLCAPWELRKTDNGRKDPNPKETWIDVQSRAVFQAAQRVKSAIREAVEAA